MATIKASDKVNSPGRRALVTGASSGLGAAIAHRLAAAGWEVHGTSRKPAAEHAHHSVTIQWHQVDLSDPDNVEAWIKEQPQLFASVHLLVNNAGFGLIGPLEALDPQKVTDQLHCLLATPVRLCQAVLPAMKTRGAGVILNVSSLAAELPLPYAATYNAAKAGLSALSTSLQTECHGSGVRVIDFRPGDLQTPFNQNTVLSLKGDKNAARAWQAMERHAAESPTVAACADAVLELVTHQRQKRARWGGWIQAHLAPLGVRLLPSSWMASFIRRYYGLKG